MTRIIGATGALLRAFGTLPLLLMAATAPAQTISNDGCGDGGGGSADVERLTAFYNVPADQFEVTLSTCGPVDPPIPYNWQTVSTTRYYHHAAGFAEFDGFVYVIGGFDGAQLIREVEYAPVTADGKIVPWRLTSPLVMPSYTTAAVAAQGHSTW